MNLKSCKVRPLGGCLCLFHIWISSIISIFAFQLQPIWRWGRCPSTHQQETTVFHCKNPTSGEKQHCTNTAETEKTGRSVRSRSDLTRWRLRSVQIVAPTHGSSSETRKSTFRVDWTTSYSSPQIFKSKSPIKVCWRANLKFCEGLSSAGTPATDMLRSQSASEKLLVDCRLELFAFKE